jgi:hypothetical protein
MEEHVLASEFVLRREGRSAHPVGESSTPPSARGLARSEEHLI